MTGSRKQKEEDDDDDEDFQRVTRSGKRAEPAWVEKVLGRLDGVMKKLENMEKSEMIWRKAIEEKLEKIEQGVNELETDDEGKAAKGTEERDAEEVEEEMGDGETEENGDDAMEE
jgi:hypothetical protein